MSVLVSVLGRTSIAGEESPSQRQRRLLAALVLHRRQFVSTGRLAEFVWGDDQPNDPVAALHTLVSRLRAFLDDRVSISSSTGAYRLTAAPGALDVDLVDAWRATTESLHGDGRVAALDALLSLFRGEAFADLDDVEALPARAQLQDTRLDICEARAASLSELGRYEEAVTVLRAVILEAPERESAVLSLMAALYASGQQVAALAAASALRRHLRDEFGIDPSPSITELELAVLRHEVGHPPGRASRNTDPPAQVPRPLTSFVGRASEVAELRALAEERRLITVIGPGGIGKTRVAMEVAAGVHAGHGITHFIELAEVENGEDLLSVVAGHVSAAQSKTASLEAAVIGRLDAGPTLVVLDNCEHLRPAVASLVARLLAATRHLSVLATSREPLRVSGEHRWMLQPLRIEDAADLFLDRARAIDRAFDATADDPRVIELCRRLDGLPLAVELAASAMSGRGLDQLIRQLADRFDTLASDDPALPPRHQSLAATLEWSYSRLDWAEQHAFDRLGVFAGAFSADEVRQLVGEQSARMLPKLVERSMLVHRDSAGASTYEMLDTMRAYARQQRGDALDDDRALHASWTLAASVDAASRVLGPDELDCFRWYRNNLANLRQAHHWFVAQGDHDNRIRLVDSLIMWAWQHRQPEVLGWAELLAADAPTEDAELAAIRAGVSTIALARTRVADVRLAEECVAAGGRASHHAAALAQYAALDVGMFVGRYDLAEQHAREALEHAVASPSSIDSVQLAFFATNGLAFANFYLGRVEEAEHWCADAERRAVQQDSLSAHGWVALARGEGYAVRDPGRAKVHADRCLALIDPKEHVALHEMASHLRTFIGTQLGDPAALERLCRHLERLEAAATWHELTTALCVAAETLATLGHAGEATQVVAAVMASSADPVAIGNRSDRMLEQARAVLGEAEFASSWATGSRWSHTEAVHLTVRTLRNRPTGRA
ncbi:MAG: BTAD domain-containing putative transcriptional regulator [Ilumatobacteraceae bacterium]